MRRTHVFRLRLTAAIGVVLATTLVGGHAATAAPASAPGSVIATAGEAGEQTVVPYPSGRTTLAGVGSTGFLTWGNDGLDRWTSFADGSSTHLAEPGWVAMASRASDVVLILKSSGLVELRDMSTSTSVLTLNPGDMGPQGQAVGAVGATLFVRTSNGAGGHDVHLVGKADGELSKRTVTGLPQDATDPTVRAGTPTHAVLVYQTPRGRQWALVDVSAGTVVKTHAMASAPDSVAVSGTRVAWDETDSTGKKHVVVAPRGTGADQRIPLGLTSEKVAVGLVGDWVTYGIDGGEVASDPNPLYALTARNLTTNATRKVLDQVRQTATAPDGTLHASGATATGDVGLYRIVLGADGAPAATLVASTGDPARVMLLGHKIPAVIDLDRTGGRFRLEWQLSRINVVVDVTLRNTRTGETKRETVYPLSVSYDDPHRVYFDWEGDVSWNGASGMFSGARSGSYTWQINARPLDGIGPNLAASGTFTVARKPGLHDYDADGYPDVLARDTTGRLWLKKTYDALEYGGFHQYPETLVGSGWNIYDRIEASGNLGGAPGSDLVARDRDGVLWLYLGTGNVKAPFASRVRIGGGWNTYTQLTGGSDLTGDGRADLVATDRAGALWLYKGTGNWRAPFASRVKIGSGGWGTYDQIAATGDIAGAAAGDLVARDRDGVLWLYLGRGNGTFAPRTRIGAGWNTYQHLLGIGDGNRDARPDVYATGLRYESPDPYLYTSTGDWRRPLNGRADVFRSFNAIRTYNLFV
ncbi:VCBS repeat-containing protein [Streptomyces sp. NPDC018693]|uniref:VCBS repeat-containing protein n=1 Tax=unclassified Streptomyces TaxID=2593676 RepID=UPI003789C3DA